LKQQHIELVRELDSELPSFLADATQLEQAFLNLTLNAVEAMPNGGRLLIRTSVQRNSSGEGPNHVLIEFTDNGLGMTKEQRSSAFESVLQTTKRRGTGLGLAIVRRVVELHRGRIEIQSEPDKGASFQILLPV
jgi:signal transduction histidine kinase